MNDGKRFTSFSLSGLLLYGIIITSIPYIVSGDGSGDYPPPSSGDWIITRPTYVGNDSWTINGNILIDSSLTIYNSVISLNPTLNGSFKIEVRSTGSLKLINTKITSTTPDGKHQYIFTAGGESLEIINNSIIEYAGYDITYPGLLVTAKNVYIANSTFRNNFRGLQINTVSNATISNNLFENNNIGGIAVTEGFGTKITRNTIKNSLEVGAVGISIFNSPIVLIDNNTLIKTGTGLSIKDSNGATISGNTIVQNYIYGLTIEYSQSTTVSRNIISTNGYGVLVTGTTSGTTLRSNSIVGNAFFALKNENPSELIDAKSNYWGTMSNAPLDKLIVGTVDRSSPLLTDPNGMNINKITTTQTLSGTQRLTQSLIVDGSLTISNAQVTIDQPTFSFIQVHGTLTITNSVISGSAIQYIIVALNGSKLSITDSEVKGAFALSTSTNNVVIDNSNISNSIYGVAFYNRASNGVVRNSVFTSNKKGVYTFNSMNITVTGSTFNNNFVGIDDDKSEQLTVSKNTIKYGDEGIVFRGTNLLVQENIIESQVQNGASIYGRDIILIGNYIRDAEQSQVYINGATNVYSTGNNISGKNIGIAILSVSEYISDNDHIFDVLKGITVDNSENVLIKNNTIETIALGADIEISNSYVRTVNSSYKTSRVEFPGTLNSGILVIQNFLTIEVYSSTGSLLEGATVEVKDNNVPIFNQITDASGKFSYIIATYGTMNKTKNITQNSTWIKVTKGTMTFGNNPREVKMSTSRIEIFLPNILYLDVSTPGGVYEVNYPNKLNITVKVTDGTNAVSGATLNLVDSYTGTSEPFEKLESSPGTFIVTYSPPSVDNTLEVVISITATKTGYTSAYRNITITVNPPPQLEISHQFDREELFDNSDIYLKVKVTYKGEVISDATVILSVEPSQYTSIHENPIKTGSDGVATFLISVLSIETSDIPLTFTINVSKDGYKSTIITPTVIIKKTPPPAPQPPYAAIAAGIVIIVVIVLILIFYYLIKKGKIKPPKLKIPEKKKSWWEEQQQQQFQEQFQDQSFDEPPYYR